MSTKYFVMPELATVEGKTYQTYSIVNPIAGVAHSVTCDREKAYDLARKFTEAELSPLHFFDVLEDILG